MSTRNKVNQFLDRPKIDSVCVSLTLNEIDRYANLLRCACRLTVVDVAAATVPLLFNFAPAVVDAISVWLSLSRDVFFLSFHWFVCYVSTVPVMFFYV